MAQYIDKDALVAKIKRRFDECSSSILKNYDACKEAKAQELGKILTIINTLEVKEVDLDALGVLAEHLIACDAHLVTPKYTDKELGLLEELAKNNKARKGE